MAGYDNYAKMISPGQPFLITPDDDNNLPYVTSGIAIGTAGTLAVQRLDGTKVIIPANCLAVGVVHPMRVKKVYSTDTTASEILGYTPSAD